MNKYIVKSPIKLNRKIHPVDAIVELDDETAARPLAKGSVELHSPREQARAINEAIKASAQLIVAGTLSIDQAAEQIAAQAKGSVAAQIRTALQDSVDELRARTTEANVGSNEQEAADARKAAEENAARERSDSERRQDAKAEKKGKK